MAERPGVVGRVRAFLRYFFVNRHGQVQSARAEVASSNAAAAVAAARLTSELERLNQAIRAHGKP